MTFNKLSASIDFNNGMFSECTKYFVELSQSNPLQLIDDIISFISCEKISIYDRTKLLPLLSSLMSIGYSFTAREQIIGNNDKIVQITNLIWPFLKIEKPYSSIAAEIYGLLRGLMSQEIGYSFIVEDLLDEMRSIENPSNDFLEILISALRNAIESKRKDDEGFYAIVEVSINVMKNENKSPGLEKELIKLCPLLISKKTTEEHACEIWCFLWSVLYHNISDVFTAIHEFVNGSFCHHFIIDNLNEIVFDIEQHLNLIPNSYFIVPILNDLKRHILEEKKEGIDEIDEILRIEFGKMIFFYGQNPNEDLRNSINRMIPLFNIPAPQLKDIAWTLVKAAINDSPEVNPSMASLALEAIFRLPRDHWDRENNLWQIVPEILDLFLSSSDVDVVKNGIRCTAAIGRVNGFTLPPELSAAIYEATTIEDKSVVIYALDRLGRIVLASNIDMQEEIINSLKERVKKIIENGCEDENETKGLITALGYAAISKTGNKDIIIEMIPDLIRWICDAAVNPNIGLDTLLEVLNNVIASLGIVPPNYIDDIQTICDELIDSDFEDNGILLLSTLIRCVKVRTSEHVNHAIPIILKRIQNLGSSSNVRITLDLCINCIKKMNINESNEKMTNREFLQMIFKLTQQILIDPYFSQYVEEECLTLMYIIGYINNSILMQNLCYFLKHYPKYNFKSRICVISSTHIISTIFSTLLNRNRELDAQLVEETTGIGLQQCKNFLGRWSSAIVSFQNNKSFSDLHANFASIIKISKSIGLRVIEYAPPHRVDFF